MVTYTIRELLENYDSHPQYVEQFNIHVIPVANPDGYEYTWTDVRPALKVDVLLIESLFI